MTAPWAKAKERHLGTKAKVRKAKEREKKIIRTVLLSVALIVVLVSGYFVYTYLQSQDRNGNTGSSQLKAAIVDHLSLTYPNETFIQAATSTLRQAGYSVDYYSGEKTTVEFYRNLATHGYRILLLRVHSSATTREEGKSPACFFTCESYSQTRYVSEQLNEQLGMCSYLLNQPPYYFAVSHRFIESCLNGKFNDTAIIMMGCEGLCTTNMAQAFIGKGARVYIGWNGSVTADNTDRAAASLLQRLVVEKETVDHAVTEIMGEMGPDPEENSFLQYYPIQSGGYIISS